MSPLRRAAASSLAPALCAACSIVSAQELPQSFDPLPNPDPEPPSLGILAAKPPLPPRAWSVGVAALDFGNDTRWSYTPISWSRRKEVDDASAWTLQLQSDGWKRINSPAGVRSGLADLIVSGNWERKLDDSVTRNLIAGLLVPTKGQVGGQKFAALASGTLSAKVAPLSGAAGAGLFVMQFANRPRPGVASTQVRADVKWTQAMGKARIIFGGALTRQDGLPAVDELSIQALFAGDRGFELRARAWTQQVEAAPKRQGVSFVLARAY